MNFIKSLAAIFAASMLTACATITKGTTDTLQVDVANCNEQTQCEATNKKGTWTFTAPGAVTFTKSDDALSISCQDGDGTVTRKVVPEKSSMVWGNLVFGGVIGGGIDSSTDAHWEVPDSVTLARNTCRGEEIN